MRANILYVMEVELFVNVYACERNERNVCECIVCDGTEPMRCCRCVGVCVCVHVANAHTGYNLHTVNIFRAHKQTKIDQR